MNNAPHVTGIRPNEILYPQTTTSEDKKLTRESGRHDIDSVIVILDGSSVALNSHTDFR